MKFDPNVSWFYKYPNSQFGIEFDFTNDLSTGDSLSTCTASIYTDDPVPEDKTGSMISNKAISSPNVTFDISGGVVNTYNIKLVGVTAGNKKFTHYITCDVFGDITLNSKLGDSNANSYVTLQEANKYIRNKYGHTSLWDTLDKEAKKRVLIEAGKDMEIFNYSGEKYYDTQALEFPRDDHDVVTGNCATPITINSFRNISLKSDTYMTYPSNYWVTGAIHITEATPLNDIRLIELSNVTTGSLTITEDFSGTPTTNTEFIVFTPIDQNIKNAQCEQVLYILDNSSDTLQNYKAVAKTVKIGDVRVDFKDFGVSKISISAQAKKLLSRWVRKNLRYARA